MCSTARCATSFRTDRRCVLLMMAACAIAMLTGTAAGQHKIEAGFLPKKRPFAERVANAEQKTPMEIMRALGAVKVDVTGSVPTDSEAPSANEMRDIVKTLLQERGVQVDDHADGVVHVYYENQAMVVTRGGNVVGDVNGIAVDVRLVHRGYLIEGEQAWPVMATLLRGITLEISPGPTRKDSERYLRTAVENLFGASEARYENPPKWDPLAGADVLTAEVNFIRASKMHLEAKMSALKYGINGDRQGLEKDAFRDVPIWAPRDVNVLGNPLKGVKSVRLARDITIPRFEAPGITLADFGIDDAYTKQKWVAMLRGLNIGFGPGPLVQYDMGVTDELRIGSTKYWFLFGSARVTAPDVLFETPDGFIRGPARIFQSSGTHFAKTGDIRRNIETAIERDVHRFSMSLQSDWLWGNPDKVAPELLPKPRERILPAPDGTAPDVPESKLTDGVYHYLKSRQLLNIPDPATKRFAAQIAWEVESAGVGAGDTPDWWEEAGGGRALRLFVIHGLKQDKTQRSYQKADKLIDRIREIDPLMYNAYDNLFGSPTRMGERHVFTRGYVDRLMRERPVGPGTLAGETIVDADRGLDAVSYWSGSDRAKEQFQSTLRRHYRKLEGAKMIRASYVPADGSRGVTVRFIWYQSRPKAFDDMLKDLPPGARALTWIARDPAELAPDRLSDAEALPTEAGKPGSAR